jgi:putative tryptophan/tyrosine transport system substrate-binding protein
MWSSAVGFLVTLTLSLLAAPFASDAQQAGKISQVGFLLLGSPDSQSRALEVFRQALHEFGYVEGQNIVFEYRWAERADQFSDLAAELVQRRIDVIVVTNTPGIHAAKEATTTIPIVILSVVDPVEARLVESLARPGGNITGVAGPITGAFCGKMLELLKEAAPGVARVAVLGSPTAHANYWRETVVAARLLDIQLHPIEVQGPDALESAFETIANEGADALLLLPTVFLAMNERRIAELAVQSRLPAIFWRRSFAAVGGLMAYGPRGLYLWRRVAALVGRILKGAQPSDLPVEQAMHFELVINLKTAEALGLTIPPLLLYQADEVIR